jgi:hypothetical protein
MQVIENKARDVGRVAKLLKTLSVTSRDAVFRKVLTRGFCYGNFSESDVTASRPRGKSLKTLEGGVTPANLRRHGPKFLTPILSPWNHSDGWEIGDPRRHRAARIDHDPAKTTDPK